MPFSHRLESSTATATLSYKIVLNVAGAHVDVIHTPPSHGIIYIIFYMHINMHIRVRLGVYYEQY